MKHLAQNIRVLRSKADLTQRELADKLEPDFTVQQQQQSGEAA